MNGAEECRPYLEHLHDEHRHIQQLVQVIQSEFFQGDPCRVGHDVRARLPERLSELADVLQHHFAEEEAGGCIEEAVSRLPSLSTQARELEHEHTVLLSSLTQLVDRVRSTGLRDSSIQAVHAEFSSFARDLLAHEAAENRLLQQGFNVNIDLTD